MSEDTSKVQVTAAQAALEEAAFNLETQKSNVEDGKAALRDAKAAVTKAKAHAAMADATDADKAAVAEAEQKVITIETALVAAKEVSKAARAALTEAKKAVKAEVTEAKRVEREAEKVRKAAEKAEKRESQKMPEQNGTRRPKEGTTTGRVWQIADTISGELKAPASRQAVLDVALAEGINRHTVVTQYSCWRKFNGVVGRVVPPLTPEQVAQKAAAEKVKADAAEAKKSVPSDNPQA